MKQAQLGSDTDKLEATGSFLEKKCLAFSLADKTF